MIDHSRPDPDTRPAPAILPGFAAVPRQCNRHDGWTAERQRRFIEALADLGSVRAAAHAVNMTPEGAYLLRRHPQAGEFRAAWEAALALGVQRLEDVAMDRALNGVEVPVYHFGEIVGTRRVYNDALLMFVLRNRAPARFAADSLNAPRGRDAASRSHLERLKRDWRREWEEERAAATPSPEAIRASIDRKVAEVRARVEARMSQRTRDAWEAFCEARDADERAELAYDPESEDADED